MRTIGFARFALGVAACATASAIGQGPNFTVERVWLSGQPLESLPGAIMGSVFQRPQIDAAGNVLFDAFYLPAGGAVMHGLFYGSAGNLQLVQTSGQPAPGFPPGNFIWSPGAWPYVLSENGTTVSRPYVGANQFTSGGGLYVGTPGNMTLAAGTGLPAAGGLPGTTTGIDDQNFRANASGSVALLQGISNPGGPNPTYGSIPAGPSGALSTVMQSYGPVPGVRGATFIPGVHGLSYSDLGWAGFAAFFQGPGIDATNNVGLFSGGPGDVRLLARTGNQAPDMPRGVTFLNFSNVPAQNAHGNVAFFGLVQGPGVTPSNNIAYWFGPREAPQVAIRTGGPAPALPGYTLQQFNWGTFISEDDRTLLSGRLAGPGLTPANDDAVWWGNPGSLELLLREGDQAPDFPTDAVISFEDPDHVSPSFARNDLGAVLMLGRLVGEGITPANDYAWWFRATASDEWQLTLRTGQGFDGRTVAMGFDAISLVLSAGTEGFGQAINDDGAFAINVRFDEGSSGIYRFTVPEPSVLALLLVAAALLGRKRIASSSDPGQGDVSWNGPS